jgi:hypothetical protein
MAEPRGRRVLVAIEPVVLEGAYAAILELIGLDEVVQFHRVAASLHAARYDAAIVTEGLLPAVRADIVITLPETQNGSHRPEARLRGHVTIGKRSDEVDIRDQREVVQLWDEHLPLEASRAERLQARRRLVC